MAFRLWIGVEHRSRSLRGSDEHFVSYMEFWVTESGINTKACRILYEDDTYVAGRCKCSNIEVYAETFLNAESLANVVISIFLLVFRPTSQP